MAGKKTLAGLQPPSAAKPTMAEKEKPSEPLRESVQTVRMHPDTLKALQYARIERRQSQNEIMLRALCADLGVEYMPPPGKSEK